MSSGLFTYDVHIQNIGSEKHSAALFLKMVHAISTKRLIITNTEFSILEIDFVEISFAKGNFFSKTVMSNGITLKIRLETFFSHSKPFFC